MAAPAGGAGAGAGGVGSPLRVAVISPERTLFEGEAESVIAPAWDGELGIMPGHAPLMALLREGSLRVQSGSQLQRFRVSGGFLQVVDNNVTVLSEQAQAE